MPTEPIVACSRDPRWLSNSWLIADRPGGTAVLVDSGAPTEPIRRRLEELDLTLTHVLCTHHHVDHVLHNEEYRAAFGCRLGGHPLEPIEAVDLTLEDGAEVRAGELVIRTLHIPGHTRGQLAFVVNDELLWTGDTLFRGSVGGTRGPGHGTFEQLRESLFGRLLALPPRTRVLPGHADETTVGRELEHNPFVRAFRAPVPKGRPCTALGRPARLLLQAPDYDGGTKCWVRFEEEGALEVVPGSRVSA